MAITLGTFTKLDDNTYTGVLKTLHVTTGLVILPVDKIPEKAPDHRVYTAGQRYEIGAGWSQVAKASGETYLNLKIRAPEFGPNWVLPPRQTRSTGRRWRHPHGAVGTPRPLMPRAPSPAPPWIAAAGLPSLRGRTAARAVDLQAEDSAIRRGDRINRAPLPPSGSA
jgi:uncharacterized protein (DUF736 family)